MKNRTKSKFLMISIVRQHLQGMHFRNMTIMLSFATLKLMSWSPRSNRLCASPSRPPMQNFPNYIKLEGERTFIILEELKELKFKKKSIFSSNVIRYSLLLRYAFLQTYRLLMREFPFSSLSLLKKITEGQLDAVKCPKS